MPRRLVANVTMLGEDGMAHQFAVGMSDSDMPGWAVDQITNPLVWEAPEPEVEPVAVPPKSGAGSGVAVWVDYARANGVPVTQDAKRDDVIAACDAAGVPTE